MDVVSAEDDWNPSLLTLEHSDSARQMLFSPDGQLLISSDLDMPKAWDTTTGVIRGAFPDISISLFGTDLRKMALSPDGKSLACSSAFDNNIRLWDVKMVLVLCTFEGHTARVDSIAFSPSGECVTSTSRDRCIRIWDTKTGRSKILFNRERKLVTASKYDDPTGVVFCPNGDFIAGYTDNHQVRIWDTKTYNPLGTLTHSHQILTMSFSPDGKFIASSSSDGVVRIWDPVTAALCGILTQSKPGYSYRMSPFTFSPDGRTIACITNDAIEIWDLKSLSCSGSIEDNAQAIAYITFSPDSGLIAAVSGKYVKLFDPQARRLCGLLEGHTSDVLSVKFSPNGKLVASSSCDNSVKLWDAVNFGIPEINETHITKLKFIGNGHSILSYLSDETAVLRDPSTSMRTFTVPGYISFHDKVECSPLNNILAYTDDDTINLWNMVTGRFYASLGGTDSAVTTIAFSPDGRSLAAAYQDHPIIIWDITKKKRRFVLRGDLRDVQKLLFSFDGRLLVADSMYSSVWLWDLTTGEPLGVVQGKTISAMTVSSDAKAIISKSSLAVTVWDANTQQIIMEFDLLRNEVVGGAELPIPPPSLFGSLQLLPLSAFDWKEDTLSCPVVPICVRKPWVARKLENIMWIPLQYRDASNYRTAIHDSTIALVGQSKRLMLIKVDLKLIPPSK
ncbi:hypothetical protein RJ035_001181 [Blastomyces gilchristii]